jgi:acetolactate synthase small subunit
MKAKAKKKVVKKAKPKKKPVAKKKVVKKVAAKKPKVSAMENVLKIIKASKNGVNTKKIKQATRYNEKKIWNAINRLKKQGKIQSAQKGLYVKI